MVSYMIDLNLPSGSRPVSPSTASAPAPHHAKWRLTGPFQAEELRSECWKEAAAKREDVKIHWTGGSSWVTFHNFPSHGEDFPWLVWETRCVTLFSSPPSKAFGCTRGKHPTGALRGSGFVAKWQLRNTMWINHRYFIGLSDNIAFKNNKTGRF